MVLYSQVTTEREEALLIPTCVWQTQYFPFEINVQKLSVAPEVHPLVSATSLSFHTNNKVFAGGDFILWFQSLIIKQNI